MQTKGRPGKHNNLYNNNNLLRHNQPKKHNWKSHFSNQLPSPLSFMFVLWLQLGVTFSSTY